MDEAILEYWRRISHSELVALVRKRLKLPATRASPPEELFNLLLTDGEGPLTMPENLENLRMDLHSYMKANALYHATTCDKVCTNCPIEKAVLCYYGGRVSIKLWKERSP